MDDPRKHIVDVEQSLVNWFSGVKKVGIIGVGNPFRRDDFIGVEIVRNLKKYSSKSVFLIEAETIPESYMQQITEFNPSHILIIDAGLIKKQPGSFQIIDSSQLLRKSSISTHTLPLRIFCDYLKKTTSAKIGLLIIQPQDISFGEGLTPKLQKTAKSITNLLQFLFSKK